MRRAGLLLLTVAFSFAALPGCGEVVDPGGEISDDISSDTTWLGDSVYVVTDSIDVNAELTIEPGAVIEFDAGTRLEVRSGGSLVADGTEDEPITFTGLTAQAGWWDGIEFRDSEHPNNLLNHVVVEYAGNDLPGNVTVGRSNRLVNSRVQITNSTFRHGEQAGLYVYHRSDVRDSENNTYTDNDVPVSFSEQVVHFLDSGSSFTGNERDYVEVRTNQAIEGESFWDNLDVPYRIPGSDLDVTGRFEIEAGTTLEFDAGGRLNVSDSDAVFIAEGTDDEPITFTGSDQQPGSWEGVRIRSSESPENLMRHVVVEYGGGNGLGNIVVADGNREHGGRLTLEDSIIRHSEAYGVYVHNSGVFDEDNNEYSGNASGDIRLPDED